MNKLIEISWLKDPFLSSNGYRMGRTLVSRLNTCGSQVIAYVNIQLQAKSKDQVRIVNERRIKSNGRFSSSTRTNNRIVFVARSNVYHRIRIARVLIRVRRGVHVNLLVFFRTPIMNSFIQLNVRLSYQDIWFTLKDDINIVRACASYCIRPARGVMFCVNVGRMAFLFKGGRFTIRGPMQIFRVRTLVTVEPFLCKRFSINIVTLMRLSYFRVFAPQGRVRECRQVGMAPYQRRVLISLRGVANSRIRVRFIVRRAHNITWYRIMAVMFIIKGSTNKIYYYRQCRHLVVFISC